MTTNWILIALLVVVLVAFIVMSISRRKKEEAFRKELESQMVAGAKVKTYSGLYGTIVSVTETTDGKIVLLETGEGKHVSYQNLHINAIYGLDTKQPVRYDAQGNVILPEEKTEEKPAEVPAVAPVEAKEEKPSKKTAKKAKVSETKPAEETVKTEKPAEKKAPAKKTTKKTTTDKK